MGLLAAGQVVTLPFPYSDLTGHKLRPVLLLAPAGHDDWILCQVTSNPFADTSSIELTADRFTSGGLRHTSYVRPSKLFTAHMSLIGTHLGELRAEVFEEIRDAVIATLR